MDINQTETVRRLHRLAEATTLLLDKDQWITADRALWLEATGAASVSERNLLAAIRAALADYTMLRVADALQEMDDE